ncbi:DUF3054 domain-containing protein [Microbacteriaceae bacterium VKM Ac-2855]|nr:DUF3054 domain-containing protein [Microbacteriaceae bacterium VKM Ac-2855]
MKRPVAALATDLLLVLVFVLIGRRSHDEENQISGLLVTFWPFAVGVLLGWAATFAWRRPLALWPSGVVVWFSAVLLGMLLRVATGQGVQWSFVIVTTIVLAAFLLGWRALVALLRRRRAR